MNQAKKVILGLEDILCLKHKLDLDNKTEEEVKTMLNHHQNSLYARFCKTFRISLSYRYQLKETTLKNTLQYHEMLRYRETQKF